MLYWFLGDELKMLYQKLLTGTAPYHLEVSQGYTFELHCHPEFELNYCLGGSYLIVIEGKELVLKEGDLVIISPMTPHELRQNGTNTCLRLTAEMGPVLLDEQFGPFVALSGKNKLFRLKHHSDDPVNLELVDLLEETARLLSEKPRFYSLSAKGNLYKISAVLLKMFTRDEDDKTVMRSLTDLERIGRAINLIYSSYDRPLTLDRASELCGYSKSRFCRVFKEITGESFHAMLNRHRIEIACLKLRELNLSIEAIALSVGFADSKSFCRTFKRLMGVSAGAYRKEPSNFNK